MDKRSRTKIEIPPDYKYNIIVAPDSTHFDIVKAILDRSPDLDARDKDGNTAFIWAMEEGQWDVIEFLQEKGAWVLKNGKIVENYRGRSVVDIVKEKGLVEVWDKGQEKNKKARWKGNIETRYGHIKDFFASQYSLLSAKLNEIENAPLNVTTLD